MKKRFRRITSALLSATLMLSCVGFSVSAQTTDLSPDEQYIALMDAIDWSEYDNHIVKQDISQIPEHLLNQMTTEQLANAVIHYPLLIDMLSYNTYSEGFNAVLEDYNGMAELVKRKDGAQKLRDILVSIPIQTNTRAVNYDAIMDAIYLDVMLAQPEFLNQLSETELQATISTIDNKIGERIDEPEIYGGSTTVFYNALNEQIQPTTINTTITTPGGKTVNVRKWTSSDKDWTYEELVARRNEVTGPYPKAVIKENATKRFNCHSYAWYSQDTANNIYWVLSNINYTLDTVAFRKISGPVYGAKVNYVNGGHSAIVTAVPSSGPVYYTSKWGNGCLVEHTLTDCPYWRNATAIEYYQQIKF